MPYRWPADTEFASWELDVVDRACSVCGRTMHVCDHRYRRLHTLDGPVELLCRLDHCPDRDCPGHAKTKSPELEASIALMVRCSTDFFGDHPSGSRAKARNDAESSR